MAQRSHTSRSYPYSRMSLETIKASCKRSSMSQFCTIYPIFIYTEHWIKQERDLGQEDAQNLRQYRLSRSQLGECLGNIFPKIVFQNYHPIVYEIIYTLFREFCAPVSCVATSLNCNIVSAILLVQYC